MAIVNGSQRLLQLAVNHRPEPARGCVWDALALAGEARPILVEAKAHIPEAVSCGTRASETSRELIETSLAQVRRHLAPRSKADWTGHFYQYANRLAYQFYMRILNKVDSSLVFLCFTNAGLRQQRSGAAQCA
jgi:hypothetical protein